VKVNPCSGEATQWAAVMTQYRQIMVIPQNRACSFTYVIRWLERIFNFSPQK